MSLAVLLKTLANKKGLSVLLSLHQPRPEIYDMMDVIGLM